MKGDSPEKIVTAYVAKLRGRSTTQHFFTHQTPSTIHAAERFRSISGSQYERKTVMTIELPEVFDKIEPIITQYGAQLITAIMCVLAWFSVRRAGRKNAQQAGLTSIGQATQDTQSVNVTKFPFNYIPGVGDIVRIIKDTSGHGQAILSHHTITHVDINNMLSKFFISITDLTGRTGQLRYLQMVDIELVSISINNTHKLSMMVQKSPTPGSGDKATNEVAENRILKGLRWSSPFAAFAAAFCTIGGGVGAAASGAMTPVAAGCTIGGGVSALLIGIIVSAIRAQKSGKGSWWEA